MSAVKPIRVFSGPIWFINVVLALVISASSAVGAQGGHKSDTPGVPWVGDLGIVETVDQIMAREEKNRHGEREHEAGKAHRHLPAAPTLQNNTLAPLASQWPLPRTSG